MATASSYDICFVFCCHLVSVSNPPFAKHRCSAIREVAALQCWLDFPARAPLRYRSAPTRRLANVRGYITVRHRNRCCALRSLSVRPYLPPFVGALLVDEHSHMLVPFRTLDTRLIGVSFVSHPCTWLPSPWVVEAVFLSCPLVRCMTAFYVSALQKTEEQHPYARMLPMQ